MIGTRIQALRRWALICSAGALLILGFTLLLSAKIPYGFTVFFSQYSPALFLVSWILFSLSFRLNGWKGWLAGLGLALIFFALPLSYKWTAAFSDNRVIGGLLPYKDQYFYYHGARELLHGNLIWAHMDQASWRPLFPSLMATILSLSGDNLKWSLGVLTFITGVCSYLAGRQMRNIGGNWAAGLFMALLFLYSQYYIGLFATELAGFAIACLAFALLLSVAQRHEKSSLFFGIVLLMLAMCMRAGAFLIFPMVVLWSGWAFRGDRRYSFRVAGVSLLVVIVSFLAFTWLPGRILVAPGATPFGNFAYTLYGQAMGGAGWARALQDIGPYPDLVLGKTFEMIQTHPLSFLIGVAKSYRDVFLRPGASLLIPVDGEARPVWINFSLWWGCALLLVWGIVRLLKQWRVPAASLLLCGFIGVVLSIPFLPPIDGGSRFYTNSAPFIVALPAFGLGELLSRQRKRLEENAAIVNRATQVAGVVLILSILMAPLGFRLFRTPIQISVPVCDPKNEVPFAIQVDPGSYVDIVPTQTKGYGLVPRVGLADFKTNGAEPWDDFYQALASMAASSSHTTRVLTTVDLIGRQLHYYAGDSELLTSHSPDRVISGCAVLQPTQHQSIYAIRSLVKSAPSIEGP